MALPDVLLSRLCRRDLSTRIAVIDEAFGPRQYGDWVDTGRDLTHVTRSLLARGYDVLPVNPWESVIEGIRCWDNPAILTSPIHVAVMLADPEAGMGLLEMLPDDVECVWFQPGAHDIELIEEARERFRIVITGDLISEVEAIQFTLPWKMTS